MDAKPGFACSKSPMLARSAPDKPTTGERVALATRRFHDTFASALPETPPVGANVSREEWETMRRTAELVRLGIVEPSL